MCTRAAAAILTACAAPALAQSPVLWMAQPPQNDGWTYFATGGGNAYISGGQLYIDSPINAFAGYGAPGALWTAASADPAGWRVQATATITNRSINSSNDGCLLLVAGDGTYRHFLELYPDHIALTQQAYSGSATYAMAVEGPTLHSYEMIALGASVTVKVDGSPVLSAIALGTSPGFNTFQFGDLLFPNESHSVWSHVEFTAVPAPAAATLLLAAPFLSRRRRP
jgi:hypothetical protein